MCGHEGPSAHGIGERGAVICGIAASLPPKTVTNAELCIRLDTTAEWISKRTGVLSRRVAERGISTEDLAVEAATKALKTSGERDAQALVLATTTPDVRCPATAPGVASRLDMTGIPAVDVSAGCSGFLYALATAAGFIAIGVAERVLVIGVERISTLLDPTDRSTTPIFGDGAGAAVLRAGPACEPGALGPIVLGSDGMHNDLIKAPNGGYLQLEGGEVFRRAAIHMCAASLAATRAVAWDIEDVDRLVAHQANARITSFVGKRLGVATDRQLQNIAHVGNTGAASIPILLAQASAEGRLVAGHRVLLTAFGSGLTWGATTVIWPEVGAVF
jgi:3-oxoacyl-[acyl-carrier-protein] synthase-3